MKTSQGPGEAGYCRPAGEWYPASGIPAGSGLGTSSVPGWFSLNATAATFQFGNSPLKKACAPFLSSDLSLKGSEVEQRSR